MPHHYLPVVVMAMASVTLLPVATQSLPPINVDHLNPDAAHVCMSTTWLNSTKLQSYDQYFTERTTTWCLAFPPRCTQYRIAKRTGYKTVTISQERKSYFCCPGYKPQNGLSYCIPTCEQDCNQHGTCTTPGTCLCYHGYKGTACESSCDRNTWGSNCQLRCNCSSHGSCHPESGNCICQIGYTGSDCSNPCVNSFGMHCINPCVCENNSTCDNVNGKCTCQSGYYGVYCHKKCDATSMKESTCVQTCPCQNGGSCHAVTGSCICMPGFKGDYCTEQCDSYHWGSNCIQECVCNNGNCNHITGACACEMGYSGNSCEIQCPAGKYGDNCNRTCTCQNGGKCYYGKNSTVLCNCTDTGFHGTSCEIRDCANDSYNVLGSTQCQSCDCSWPSTESCHPRTGVCQCKIGYQGLRCFFKCTEPYYGKDCMQVCSCNHGFCNSLTGECTSCYAGYVGVNCEEVCPSGKYGLNCSNSCMCLNGATCHASTGYCNCSAGFTGTFCEQPCPFDKYGMNCESSCTCNATSATCNPYNGQCQCKTGYHGNQCQYKCADGWYGILCQQKCFCDTTGTQSCDFQTGECICKSGWRGVTCDSKCSSDSWGPLCQKQCSCNARGTCDQMTGQCSCYPGYIGDQCDKTCLLGYYGYNCTSKCPTCYFGSICDFKTGECIMEICPPGFTGLNCQELCSEGTWGQDCAGECPVTCIQNGQCNPVNGACMCYKGYYGAQCQLECALGWYGSGCLSKCPCQNESTLSCDHRTGQCTCKSGYKGEFCQDTDIANGVSSEQTSDAEKLMSAGGSVMVIAVSIVAAVVLMASILIVTYFCRKVRRLKDERNIVLYNAAGTLYGPTVSHNDHMGIDNPSYVENNTQNDQRYPHLSQRSKMSLPPVPCQDDFDDFGKEKLFVSMGCASSGLSSSQHTKHDDTDRYTTLKSVTRNKEENSDMNPESLFGNASADIQDSDEAFQDYCNSPNITNNDTTKANDIDIGSLQYTTVDKEHAGNGDNVSTCNDKQLPFNDIRFDESRA